MSEKLIFRDSDIPPNVLRPPRSRSMVNEDGNIVFLESYRNNSEIRTPLLDHKILIDKPEMRMQDSENNSGAYYYANPYYNYIATEWENNFSTLPVLRMPNLYVEASNQPNIKILDNKTTRKMAKRYNKSMARFFNFLPRKSLERYRNIVFSSGYFRTTRGVSNKFKNNYPFYNELFFYQRSETKFATKMLEAGLYDLFIQDYISKPKQTRSFGDQEVQIYDLKNWTTLSDFNTSADDKIILSDGGLGSGFFASFLKKTEFMGFIRSMTEQHQRTAAEVMNGKPAYSEVLFHRVEKVNSTNGQVIQSYWFPSSQKRQNLVDTQVKYGQEYEYRFYCYLVVIGAELSRIPTGEIKVSPSIQVAEVPLFSQTCLIVQPPQPPPDVRFYNNQAKQNKIRVSLCLNSNNYDKLFVPISDSEVLQDSVISKYNPAGNKRYFNYETEHALFEVYRTDKHPKSFEDFEQFKIAEIKNSVASTSAMFEDTLLFDKEYFYTFRSINTHGLFSNPSPIFKVILLKDANETKLDVESVGLLEEEMTQGNIVFQKLLQLVPSSLHTTYNFNDSGLTTLRGKINDLKLGLAEEEPIWGRRFKFRITSKDTGKKIDLNVTVNLTRNKTEEDL